MKKIIRLWLIQFMVSASIYAQDSNKWNSSVYIDLTSNTSNEYIYYDSNNKINEASINEKGAFEIVYNIDYRLLNKFTASAITSYNHFVNPSSSSLKIGSGIKFLYVDNKYHYLTLQYGYHIPFNKDNFREGHQIKIGQYFDVTKLFNHRLLLGIFYNYDFLYLDGSQPLFLNSNRASSLKYNSFGISLGIKL
tara:strand:+ start:351 stop:929 length:579 start_codon:yes stop_codon:yes gene_type:complete